MGPGFVRRSNGFAHLSIPEQVLATCLSGREVNELSVIAPGYSMTWIELAETGVVEIVDMGAKTFMHFSVNADVMLSSAFFVLKSSNQTPKYKTNKYKNAPPPPPSPPINPSYTPKQCIHKTIPYLYETSPPEPARKFFSSH